MALGRVLWHSLKVSFQAVLRGQAKHSPVVALKMGVGSSQSMQLVPLKKGVDSGHRIDELSAGGISPADRETEAGLEALGGRSWHSLAVEFHS